MYFIEVKDGKIIGHPLLKENVEQVLGRSIADGEQLTNLMRFEKHHPPSCAPFERATESYVLRDGFVESVWTVSQISDEEKNSVIADSPPPDGYEVDYQTGYVLSKDPDALLLNRSTPEDSEVSVTFFASAELATSRVDTCKQCDKLFLGQICRECSCIVHAKARITSQFCPLGKW
jgi:hypothetical protein